jgi:hypothetical protein
MILPTPADRLEAIQTGLRSQFENRKAPQVLNDHAVASIVEGNTFEFPEGSAVHYFVPPVDYQRGARLEKLALRIQEIRRTKPATEELVDERVRLQDAAIAELARLIRPVSWGRWMAWPLLSRVANPFRHCTDREVASLLLFFCSLTTKHRVRFSGESRG